ncbi:MAG: hypothetical protein WAM71_03475 [Candidatus Korobacteraceae bacterium]
MAKVLIVDKSIDRKKRIAALKERGLSVFPALQLNDARSRCRPGAYDLIIVNCQDELETAAAFCDDLGKRTPPQAVLLAVSNGSSDFAGEYAVADDPETLAKRAAALLGQSAQPEERSEQCDREHTSARVSA